MERRLRIAVGAALVELVVQLVVLTARGTVGGAPLRLVFLLGKLPFCVLTLRRNAGGYLGVMLYEFGAIAAAFAVKGALPGRLAFGLAGAIVMVLLGRAVSAFPPVEWKSR